MTCYNKKRKAVLGMNKAVLIVGYGPYGYCLAKKFENLGYSIIMTMIKTNSQNQVDCDEFHQIKADNLHEKNCEIIHDNCIHILNEHSLNLTYIIHTARFSDYEFNKEDEFSDDIKDEMFKVNSESPHILAKLFLHTGCKFVFTSSGASMGFSKNLSKKAILKKGKYRIGTRGLKHYSYVKRVGEERLYEFFKDINRLDLLVIIYITFMHGTNFFADMKLTNIQVNGLDAKQTAEIIVSNLIKGKTRIYPGFKAKALSILPSWINALLLNSIVEEFYPLENNQPPL